jgi:hypothetical protein
MQGIRDLRIFPCGLMIERSADGGYRFGHCLKLEVVSPGESEHRVVDTIHEAAERGEK